jgi:hypothetical protein
MPTHKELIEVITIYDPKPYGDEYSNDAEFTEWWHDNIKHMMWTEVEDIEGGR